MPIESRRFSYRSTNTVAIERSIISKWPKSSLLLSTAMSQLVPSFRVCSQFLTRRTPSSPIFAFLPLSLFLKIPSVIRIKENKNCTWIGNIRSYALILIEINAYFLPESEMSV